jgi:parallel beta-helix repeat protein
MPDIIVKNQTELDAALRAATGGETIKLLAGTYSNLRLTNRNFASNVTITSADPNHPATIQYVNVNSSNNVTFKSLDIGRPILAPEAEYTQLSNVTSSTNIMFDSVHISGGSGDPSKSLGWGMFVRDGSNITIQNSTVDHVTMGMQLNGVDNLVLKNNTFENNRRDSLNLSEVTNVVIDGNFFTNNYPLPGEHPDAIQFFTAGTTQASSNIVIKNNIVMQGDGGAIQGIFMNDEAGNLPYTNVDITNNLIYVSGLYNGITIAHGSNINIQQNTVVSRTDDAAYMRIALSAVNGATIANNISDDILIDPVATNISLGNNSKLRADSAMLRKFANLNAQGAAKLSGLIVDDLGYHPPAGSAAASIVAAELAAAKVSPTKNLMLDLEFKPGGLTDQSRFNSSSFSAIDPTAIANGSYHVQTGKGFEVAKGNSVQLFGLSAMTLTFDLQRDSATATTGQVIGVFQSWSVSLQSNGELNFTVKNAAGTTTSITTQGAKLVDTKNHKIGVTYDSATGRAIIYVDNVAKGTGAVSGPMRNMESWGLYVGNAYGTAFSGRLGSIEVRDQALTPAQLATTNSASDFGLLKKVSSFAGIVGQIVSGGQSASASAMVAEAAPASAASTTVAKSSGTTGSTAAIAATTASFASSMSSSTASLAVAPLALNSIRLGRTADLDMFHA